MAWAIAACEATSPVDPAVIKCLMEVAPVGRTEVAPWAEADQGTIGTDLLTMPLAAAHNRVDRATLPALLIPGTLTLVVVVRPAVQVPAVLKRVR